MEEIIKKIEELGETIRYHNDRYYLLDGPETAVEEIEQQRYGNPNGSRKKQGDRDYNAFAGIEGNERDCCTGNDLGISLFGLVADHVDLPVWNQVEYNRPVVVLISEQAQLQQPEKLETFVQLMEEYVSYETIFSSLGLA